MSEMDIDRDFALQPLSCRERLAVRLVLMLLSLLAPCKYAHQLDKWIEQIRGDLGK